MHDAPTGLWQHFRGNYYSVIGVSGDANADELYLQDLDTFGDNLNTPPRYNPLRERLCVVYIPLHYVAGAPLIWHRTVDDFLATGHVTWDSHQAWRFEVCKLKDCDRRHRSRFEYRGAM